MLGVIALIIVVFGAYWLYRRTVRARRKAEKGKKDAENDEDKPGGPSDIMAMPLTDNEELKPAPQKSSSLIVGEHDDTCDERISLNMMRNTNFSVIATTPPDSREPTQRGTARGAGVGSLAEIRDAGGGSRCPTFPTLEQAVSIAGASCVEVSVGQSRQVVDDRAAGANQRGQGRNKQPQAQPLQQQEPLSAFLTPGGGGGSGGRSTL
mmetsp:Transcript_120468/g.312766  ORF Transcript_120468/g.312766 Transcript_120468/m.312766 type:complete len:208 (-) Transcript_120468:26-649(-)